MFAFVRARSPGEKSFELRGADDLLRPFDRLVLQGGESTVQGKLLCEMGLLGPIRKSIRDGMPVLGTCAGLILLVKNASRRMTTGTPRASKRWT